MHDGGKCAIKENDEPSDESRFLKWRRWWGGWSYGTLNGRGNGTSNGHGTAVDGTGNGNGTGNGTSCLITNVSLGSISCAQESYYSSPIRASNPSSVRQTNIWARHLPATRRWLLVQQYKAPLLSLLQEWLDRWRTCETGTRGSFSFSHTWSGQGNYPCHSTSYLRANGDLW